MKLNNKGFAIASILYSIMVLFLMLLLSILGILGSRKAILDKNKKDILDSLNSVVTNNRINFEHRNITIINRGNTDDILFALMDGVTAIDKDGNQINSGNISYNLNVNNIEDGDYTVTYSTNSNGSKIIATRKVTIVSDDISQTFSYTGDSQTFTSSQNGSYKIELWGASGGTVTNYSGGSGGYAVGIVDLLQDENVYVVVGGQGVGAISSGEDLTGGYNGGGSVTGKSTWNHINASGGGATHVAINNNLGLLKNYINNKDDVLMVAGGGGGARDQSNHVAAARWGFGGHGGGLNGIGANSSNGSTITLTVIDENAGKENSGYQFGLGESCTGNSGGGGGWYGGYSGSNTAPKFAGAGSGGSGYINHKIVSNSIMYAGDELMPTHDGMGNMTGNSGDGYAKISLIYYY